MGGTTTLREGPVNHAPVAVNDNYNTPENTSLNVAAPGILANDTDIDGNTLTAIQASNQSHGTLTLNANGSLTYTPDANWSGTDSFTYKASDGTLDSDPATVTIVTTSSNPQPPVLDPLGSRSGTVGQLLTFTVSAVDPNGDPLTYSASGLPSGASFNATTHTFTWTPPAAGTFTGVRFTVSDGSLSDSEDITITIGAAPTLTEITRSVATGTDDGFSGSWGFYTSQTWYEAGTPGQPYSAWFRFTGITIPAGATILEAHLETMHAAWVSGTTLKISADKAPAPTAPTSTANHASRVRTTTSVNWTSGYSDWAWHNSPDFASVIQELVNSYDYSSGGTVQLLVDDNGSSSGSEHDGGTFESGYLPRLYIKYQITPNYMVIYNANGATAGTVPANQVKTPGVRPDPGHQHRQLGQGRLHLRRLEHRSRRQRHPLRYRCQLYRRCGCDPLCRVDVSADLHGDL